MRPDDFDLCIVSAILLTVWVSSCEVRGRLVNVISVWWWTLHLLSAWVTTHSKHMIRASSRKSGATLRSKLGDRRCSSRLAKGLQPRTSSSARPCDAQLMGPAHIGATWLFDFDKNNKAFLGVKCFFHTCSQTSLELKQLCFVEKPVLLVLGRGNLRVKLYSYTVALWLSCAFSPVAASRNAHLDLVGSCTEPNGYHEIPYSLSANFL